MGNSKSKELNKHAFHFEMTEHMFHSSKQIGITKLDEKEINKIEILINKLNSKFTNSSENVLKIMKALNHYINTESEYTLGQIDAYNFITNGKIRLQIVNLSAKKNQCNGGVNTKYYYIKICELDKI